MVFSGICEADEAPDYLSYKEQLEAFFAATDKKCTRHLRAGR